jgi:hypothetical protein
MNREAGAAESGTSPLLLRCPKCRKEMQIERLPHDYPEAERLEVACEDCNRGDFEECCYFDSAGKHITRDPSAASAADADREMYGEQSDYGYDHRSIGNK